jgi:outer membrane protein TolC
VAAGVRWPLLDGGAAAAQVRAQEAALESARLAWQAALLAALQDVDDNLVALARGAEREAALAAAAASAERSVELARQRYGSGLADFATLLDSERTLLGSRDSLAAARSDLAIARVRLAMALGGDLPPGNSAAPALDTTAATASDHTP